MGVRAIGTARFVVIAGVYCAALVLFRQFSIANWFILTGFHLAVLLLVPYKHWPALMVGDAARLTWISVACYHQFGLLWSLANVIPSICYFAPVVWMFRERWGLSPHRRNVQVPALVLCSFLVSLIATLVIVGQIIITPKPAGYVVHYGELIARLTLGNFLGALTVTPIALVGALFVRDARGDWSTLRRNLMSSRLMFDGFLLVVPFLMFLVWEGVGNQHARGDFQMAMFLPVVWLALRHGWKGAAMGGTFSSLAIMALMPASHDQATVQAEALVAMAIATMLLVGARIAVLDKRAEQERQDMRLALALAQRNVHAGEVQLRVTAQALDQISDTIHHAFTMILNRLRLLQPAVDEGGYRRHVQGAQEQLYRLSDTLHPLALRDRGLMQALREGPLARMLDEAGAVYWTDTRGPISTLSSALTLTIYRIVTEAVAMRCMTRDHSDFHIRIRCRRGQRPWVVVQIDARCHPVRTLHVRWDELTARLQRGVSGLGVTAIADRAATFEGRVRERAIRDGVRVSVLLVNPDAPAVQTTGAHEQTQLRVGRSG